MEVQLRLAVFPTDQVQLQLPALRGLRDDSDVPHDLFLELFHFGFLLSF